MAAAFRGSQSSAPLTARYQKPLLPAPAGPQKRKIDAQERERDGPLPLPGRAPEVWVGHVSGESVPLTRGLLGGVGGAEAPGSANPLTPASGCGYPLQFHARRR